MADGYTIDDTGAAVYPNGFRWACEDMGCAFVAREWHGGQWSALYALGCGDFSPETVDGAHDELGRALKNDPGEFATAEDWSAYEDLGRWVDGLPDID